MVTRKGAVLVAVCSFMALIVVGFIFVAIKKNSPPKHISPVSIETISPTPTPILTDTHILILGLDGRRGDKRPRCDAIHILSLEIANKKIRITSIPRGTKIDLPNVATQSAYLANACHVAGIDFALKEIKKITGIQPQYLIKVGFSQSLGIFRILNLPPVDTLQSLRSRSYPGGDLQRNRNQALFLKDLFNSHFEKVNRLPRSVRYLMYKMVDTTMPFEQVEIFLRWVDNEQFIHTPERIELVTKPYDPFLRRDTHILTMRGSSGLEEKDDGDFQKYQNEISAYLEYIINQGDEYLKKKDYAGAQNLISTPFAQQLWLQVEDELKRNTYYWNMLRIVTLSNPDREKAKEQIADFIVEMEVNKKTLLVDEGKRLLSALDK